MARSPPGFLIPVLGAAHREARPIQDVGVDHRRRDVAVTEELLHRADVRARLQQMGSEAMPQRVASDGFRDVRLARRVPDGALQDRLVQVVAPRLPSGRFDIKARGRKDVLPSPLAGRARVFRSRACQKVVPA